MNQELTNHTRSVLHERLCLREHRDLRFGILVVALVQVLFTMVAYMRGKLPTPPSTFEIVGLSVAFVFCLLLSLAMPCFEERSIIALIAVGMALEGLAQFVTRENHSLLWVQHCRAAEIAIGIAVAAVAALSPRRRHSG